MIVWALYYVHPSTGERLACYSTKHMWFHRDDPVLLAQKKNVEKVLRDYRKSAIEQHYEGKGYDTYLAKGPDRTCLLGSEKMDLACFRIVPMDVLPNFVDETMGIE